VWGLFCLVFIDGHSSAEASGSQGQTGCFPLRFSLEEVASDEWRAKKKQIPHRHSRDNRLRAVEWAIIMRGHGCSACHPEPGRLVLANGGASSFSTRRASTSVLSWFVVMMLLLMVIRAFGIAALHLFLFFR
jgi:hypothetical protein